jgi:serine protease AprX
MKKIITLLVLMATLNSFSQEDAIVYFNNKLNSATYLANPLTMLTQRSLDRRINQGIALNIQDVPITQSYINQILALNTIEVLAKSKWLNCVYVRGLQSDISSLATLSFVNNVKFLDPSLTIMSGSTLDNPSSKAPNKIIPVNKTLETLVNYNYGTSANQIQMMNGHLLHQQGFTGAGKIIAVLDAGFPGVDTAQPFQQLFTNNAILGGYDFVNKSTNFYTGNGHGTLVLSCMGGYTDGQLVGTAPDAKYYLYITEDTATENPVEEANWVEAAEEADRVGADVITSSLGYFGYDNPAYSHVYDDMTGDKNFASKGVNIAFSKGIVVVVSAGNEGANPEPHVGVPAEANNALAIGAVKSNRTRASFSSIGPSFDGRVKPDVMAQGQASVLSSTTGTIITANGTSFSGPILAGMVASFWQAVPTLTNQQVVNYIKQSSDNFATPNGLLGYGIPNFQLALNLGTNNFENHQTKFTIAPNPANNEIEIAFPNEFNNANITFFNALGQNVLQSEISINNNKIDVTNLSSGIYFYKINENEYSQTGKLIKN